ncbi:MAG: hypothetical protein KDK70_19820 [Myxococcales bacterium]|nr:hypothetical protein [Myxococcales bacterium]
MRSTHDLAALGLIGAALALLMTVLIPRASWAASADRPSEPSADRAAAQAAAQVEWGLHRVELERTTVVVRSTWALVSAPTGAVALAAPLPASAQLTGAEPVADATGRIVALTVPPGTTGRAALETRVPWGEVERIGSLPVPVPAGSSVHRVVLDPALSFSPDPALGLIAQVGHYAPAELDVVARHRFDARTDGNLRHVGAYYVRGQDLAPVGALRGEVALQRHRMGRAALVAGGVFGLAVLVMLVAQRRLGRHVRYERAEAYLAREFEGLEPEPEALATEVGARPMPPAPTIESATTATTP